MSGTLQMYDTATLLEVQQRPDNEPDGFWMRYFPDEVLSSTEEIIWDDLGDRDRRLAPFVAPMAQGRVMRDKGFISKSFRPAYVKPKHVVSPHKAIHRRAGEPLLGGMSPMQRFDAAVADNMQTERDLIERRLDWMAAQAIAYGAVTVVGEDYPEQYVDFGRDSSLTDVLTGSARWGESGADPLGDIKGMRHSAFSLGGYPVMDLIFGADAWALFAADADVKALLSTQTRGSTSDFNPPALSTGAPYSYEGALGNAAVGTGGMLRLWTYSNYYETTLGGTRVGYIDTYDVIGVGNPMGKQAFGAIMDADAGLASLRMFPKMWKNQDPSVVYTMTQSAPLMVPMNPNSTFRIRAHDGL